MRSILLSSLVASVTLGVLVTSGGCSGPGGSSSTRVGANQAELSTRVGTTQAIAGGGLSTRSISQGAASATALQSLKYFITNITVCDGATFEGTAYRPVGHCMQLYKAPAPDAYSYSLEPTADWTPLADKARKSDDGFIDLMDPKSRAKLATTTALTTDDVGSYSYGMISWSLPIKVKAAIPMSDKSTMYTHDGPTVRKVYGDNPSASYTTVSATPLTQGPAEEAVTLSANGGTWFKFQNPLVITKEDLDAKQDFTLDLTFNPDGVIKGFGPGASSPAGITEAGAQGGGILIPLLDLTPVPHRANEHAIREVYMASVSAGADDFDLRIELYSVKEDPARTIYGVDARVLPNDKTSTPTGEFNKVTFLAEQSGALELQSWSKSPSLSGFQRQSVEGQTTTATLHCSRGQDGNANKVGMVFAGCASGSVQVTFTLVKIESLL